VRRRQMQHYTTGYGITICIKNLVTRFEEDVVVDGSKFQRQKRE